MKLRIVTVEGLLQPSVHDGGVYLCSRSCPHLQRTNDLSWDARCGIYGQKLARGLGGIENKRCAPCLKWAKVATWRW